MAKLRIDSGPDKGTQIELQPGLNRLGRAADNDIRIDEPSISGHHCELVVESGTARIFDLGSTNGTFIDGQPIQEATLHPGQRLQLGSLEASYVAAIAVRVAAPPPARPQAAPALPSGMSPCKNHAMNPAEWLCGRCHQLFCNACVLIKTRGRKPAHVCATCGGQCTPFGLGVFAKKEERKSFFSQLPDVFMYPFRGNGLILLTAGTIFFGFLSLLRRAPVSGIGMFAAAGKIMVTVISFGYLFSYLQKIILSSAQGDDEMPAWPDFTEYWSDIIRPYLQGMALLLLCLGPALLAGGGALVGFGLTGDLPVGTAVLSAGLALIGLSYLPMALLAVAMADSMAGINPLFVIPSILKVPVEYLVACCVLIAVFIVQVVAHVVLGRIIPMPVLPALLNGFVSLYFLTAEMRLLGVMYHTNKEKLNWF